MDKAREWLESIHRKTGNTPGADWAKEILERLDEGDELRRTIEDSDFETVDEMLDEITRLDGIVAAGKKVLSEVEHSIEKLSNALDA